MKKFITTPFFFLNSLLNPKRISILLLTLLSSTIAISQTIYITSQWGIDNFDPSISVIPGSLNISGNNITDLSPLSNLTSIGSQLHIGGTNVTNINGFPNLTSIGGQLSIAANGALTNISGFESLTSVGDIRISNNGALMNISGFLNLTSIDDDLLIYENEVLTNIDGFEGLTSVGGDLKIYENEVLTNIDGFESLTSVGLVSLGSLVISVNASLTDISGFPNLTSIYDLFFSTNASLTDISGFPNLTSIYSLTIRKSGALMNISGFPNLTSIDEYVKIHENEVITNIDGFESLTSIGRLSIYDNIALTNIDGFESLSVGEGFSIYSNNALTIIDGFENLLSLDGLGIFNNVSLTNIDGFENLDSIISSLTIRDNASLTNIDCFENPTSIGSLSIYDNDVLTNIDGFENLGSIKYSLKIYDNDDLTNIDCFENLTSIGHDLEIYDNASLSNCCGVQHLLTTPGAIGGSINIYGNPSECSSQEEIESSSCNSCWENEVLEFCLSSGQWEPVAGQQNKMRATDIISVNDFLYFDGTMTIDTVELEITASGEFYVKNIPLPGGSIGKYSLSNGTYNLKLLGSDGAITNFLNAEIAQAPKIFETELKLDKLQLVKTNNETGLKITCTIKVPGISGDCGGEQGGSTDIQLNGLGITTGGISLDGINIKDLGMFIPKFCLKQLNVHYNSPKDILTAGVAVSMPFGDIGGGFKLEEGLIDSIGWLVEASVAPFVLGTTTIGIKGFFGHIANITKPAIEVELGGIFSDILSDDLYRITASGKTVWPTYFEIAGTGHFMRPILNSLPFQLQGGISLGYNIPNSLLNVKVNGNFGTLDEAKWLMSGNGLLRVNHRTQNTTFNGYFNGMMNVSTDVFVNDPPMPIPYITSILGLPFSVETKNTVHYGTRKNFFGSFTMEHWLLGRYNLKYLIDLTLPMDHNDYFFWQANKEAASRSQNRLDGEQINVPEQTEYSIIHVISETSPPTSTISSPSGKIYTTSSEEDRILYSEGLNGKEAFWTLLEPQAGTWMIELDNPASTDSVFYYNSEKINDFEFTVEQDGSIISLNWDPTELGAGETVNALLDDDDTDFNGFQVAEADATAGSLSFELDSSTPDCQYYLYAELVEEMNVQQVYADDILYNSNTALAPPQNFRAEFMPDTVGFEFSWDVSVATDIAGYTIIVSDNTGNDSVYATLHPTETEIILLIEDYANKSVLIQSFDEEYRIGCPSVLDGLSQDCSVVSTSLIETICQGETYAVGNSVYSETGVYSDILVTTEGCDSTVTLNLTVIHLNNVISEEEGVLISYEENATSYQWFDCDSGNDITGADQQSYTPTGTGNYAVRIVKNGCEKTSDCLYFVVTGVKEVEISSVNLSPNPANNLITIDAVSSAYNSAFIIDRYGRKLIELKLSNSGKSTFDISNLSPGTYFIRFEGRGNPIMKKLIKI